jgi:hypothetical protein
MSLDLSDMPRSICGWPSLHTGGKFPMWNTRLAQYLLGNALGENITVNGIFTNETTNEIESFQTQTGLPVNGYLNIDTWPSLISTVTPLKFGAAGRAVQALQDALTANGFNISINGLFDTSTAAALSSFQVARGATITSGAVVDQQTWHLLATQCNISMPGHYWFDSGWPQGNIDISTLQCLRQHHFEYSVHECWTENNGSFWKECVQNIANSWAAGFQYVDVYMFPERYSDPTSQAKQLLGNLTLFNVQYGSIMLDIEGNKWTEYSTEENRQFMLELRAVFDAENIPMSMYCSSVWNTYFGSNFTAFNDIPLIYAHYDNVPSFYDWDFDPYGGWEVASGKQFWDAQGQETLCGLPLDWDWSPNPFWAA